MKHTDLTAWNFASFASVMAGVGFVTVGLGAVDMAMVAGFGNLHIAAVGQGEILVATCMAALKGVVDSFSARLAIREGQGTTSVEFPALFASLLVLLLPCEAIALGVAAWLGPFLTVAGQPPELIGPILDYVGVRLVTLPSAMLFLVFHEALKICGLKSFTLVNLVIGFGLNLLFDLIFLRTPLLLHFASIEQAVSLSTVVAQLCMAVLGGVVFFRAMRRDRRLRISLPSGAAVRRNLFEMARTAPGTAARHLNDYAGSVLPLLFVGSLGVSVLASAQVATKIFTIFCRIPQACLAGVFTFYGYGVGRQDGSEPAIIRRLLRYSSIPTFAAAALVYVGSGAIVGIFGAADFDRQLAVALVAAYLCCVPAYFFEQFLGECLAVRQAGLVLLLATTVATYAFSIPAAWYAVAEWHSAFFALASKGIGSLGLALYFAVYLSRRQRAVENCHA